MKVLVCSKVGNSFLILNHHIRSHYVVLAGWNLTGRPGSSWTHWALPTSLPLPLLGLKARATMSVLIQNFIYLYFKETKQESPFPLWIWKNEQVYILHPDYGNMCVVWPSSLKHEFRAWKWAQWLKCTFWVLVFFTRSPEQIGSPYQSHELC